MRTLYHFFHSPFSRRVRLALAHKGLDVELREGREKPEWWQEARRLSPLRTLPVLVDGQHVIGDSGAIAQWLDRAYRDSPRLWPDDDARLVFEVATLVDLALNTTVDLGTRYFALRGDPAWNSVKTEMTGRAVGAFEAIASRVTSLGRSTVAASGWSAADMWLYTAVAWFEGMPARASSSQNIAQILTLGVSLPAPLSKWADAHRNRADVRALTA
jgi:glutathione S-transferase